MSIFTPMDDIVRIKDFTKRIGITQEELAKRLGVDKNTVSNWAKGRRFPPRKKERALLEMGMTVEELFNKAYHSSAESVDRKSSLWDVMENSLQNMIQDMKKFKQQGEKK